MGNGEQSEGTSEVKKGKGVNQTEGRQEEKLMNGGWKDDYC